MTAKPSERLNLAKRAKICFNCLRTTHSSNQCTNENTCKNCGLKHHTLLHLDMRKVSTTEGDTSNEQGKEHGPQSTVSHLGASHPTTFQNVILSTALVRVSGKNGQTVLCRALLDSGSQSHFVTSSLTTELGIDRINAQVIVNGISSAETTVNEKAEFTVSSRLNNKPYHISALVTPRITIDLPVGKMDTSNWDHLQGVQLADPTFHLPGKIDLLIGAELFYEIVQDGKQFGPEGAPILQNSKFGWIVAGHSNNSTKTDPTQTTTSIITCCTTYRQLEKQIENFWKVEEIPRMTIMSKEDQLCENHFLKTFKRDENGRYVVQLPFKEIPHKDNNSYDVAVRRLAQVERSLLRSPSVYDQYRKFMSDYLQQNHMELVQPTEKSPTVFLPHHHVSRPSSVTTKLRVVFDGSAVVCNGKSLNDMLHRGHKLQRDIVRIITRFRMHKYVYTADIRQMFRQIGIHSDDQCYQGIVWRNHPSEPIKQYKLKTVTYGLITSPFHALRTLAQLAIDEQASFPEGSTVLQNDFYVDEVMSGCNNVNAAKDQIQQLNDLLRRGGFDLRKWASNTPALLEGIPAEHQLLQFSIPDQNSVSVLGILWNTARDTFSFKVEPTPHFEQITKRELLGEIALTYDPCGWLAPLIIVAKVLMQRLWQTGTQWDEPVSKELLEHWIAHRTSYKYLQQFEIPRHVGNLLDNQRGCILHGFSDSSERAYAAAIYIIANDTGQLLVSKTRVAPLKKVTIPRLELCGATLLAQLMNSLIESLQLQVDTVTMWTDSTVTLQWIQSDANKWTTFVSNRVTLIQSLVPAAQWRHVRSADNPADLASRGTSGEELINDRLWWHGPCWLSDPNKWPELNIKITTASEPVEELKDTPTVAVSLLSKIEPIGQDLLTRCSNYERLNRISAYIYRFCYNCKNPRRLSGHITVQEYKQGVLFWIRIAQHSVFSDEVKRLKSFKPVATTSVLASLDPFIDDTGLLRVGGRLRHADISYGQKYPILLPKNHPYIYLIIKQVHIYYLHASLEVTMSVIRQKYWLVHCRSTIKKVIHGCIPCVRSQKELCQQVMADLPAARVTVAPVFARVGVDFAGPITTKPVEIRTRTVTKSYLALFVCMTTKSIHLEVVSDLTTEGFIATLKRFVSRRGCPSDIYSDNGTNFVGANNKLRALYHCLSQGEFQKSITNHCVSVNINWHFNPPASPHHGGLWQANIKSTKIILYKNMGNITFTFEELNTICCQIEAILNSRPLCALDDGTVLTPGHFIIGRPLLAVPEDNLLCSTVNNRKRWNIIQKITQTYWKQWSNTYLNNLQQRSKWRKPQDNLAVGDLVILRDTGTSSTQWPMARVIEVFPSSADNHVRVVRIRTSKTELIRPITKLVKLPIEH